MKRWMAILAMFLAWMPMASPSAEEPLGSVRAITALTNEEADRRLPVSFEATVTYFRSYEKTLFVQDGNAGMYVNATTDLKLVPGDRILIRGNTAGSFKPIVISSDITLLRHGNPPQPMRASYTTTIRSLLDSRYAVVHGTVRVADLTLTSGRPVTQMELQTDGGIVGVTMDSANPSDLNGLLDAEVEVTGTMGERFDGKMQVTGLLLHVMSFENVKIIRRATTDAWSVPVTPMDQVLNASNVEDRSERVRVEGTLTYYRPTSMAILQDGSRSIRVQTPQTDRLRIGDSVEALGIPAVENGFLTLKLGQIRSTGPAPSIVPPLLTWEEIASGKYAFNLVSVEGTLVSQAREHRRDVYTISAGTHVFSATMRHPFVYEWNARNDPPPVPVISPGSKVRVTGVALLDAGDPFNGAQEFGILLRTSSDVAVIAHPSLLNVRNLLLLLGMLTVIALAAVARGYSLERRVRREMAVAATVERWRSRILEEINRVQPLPEIMTRIVDLVSYKLKGTPCWCKLATGETLGNRPADLASSKLAILEQQIPSRTGAVLGTMYAGIQARSGIRAAAPEALFSAAQLAALAIETRGLYTDLVHRSEFDLLTDIYNRFSVEKQLDRLIEGGRREDSSFGLIYIDLDDFKLVNDQYGHSAGDQYLQEVARRMNGQLRPGDMLARLGGDEFAAIVPNVRNRADVAEIAARMEHCFEKPFVLEECTIRGSASVGIALYPDDGGDRESLLSSADAAMYVAKNTRRG